jgi:hypothetical protein
MFHILSCLRCAQCSLFQQNRFVGTIPDSIALLPALTNIDFENNTLTGAVPAAFWENPSLTSLYAEHWQRKSGTTHAHTAHVHTPARVQTETRTHQPVVAAGPSKAIG